jgi:hypothetical protein
MNVMMDGRLLLDNFHTILWGLGGFWGRAKDGIKLLWLYGSRLFL